MGLGSIKSKMKVVLETECTRVSEILF